MERNNRDKDNLALASMRSGTKVKKILNGGKGRIGEGTKGYSDPKRSRGAVVHDFKPRSIRRTTVLAQRGWSPPVSNEVSSPPFVPGMCGIAIEPYALSLL
jgi:hypothetical protein